MRYLKIFICFFIITIFTGCSTNEKIISNINDSNKLKNQQNRDSQTLWSILDSDGNEKKVISETDKNVEDIIHIIEKHCSIIDNRNYNKLNVQDEYEYYNDNFITVLNKSNYKESVKKMYMNNKLILNQGNIIWYKNYFNEDMNKCKVTIESEFKIKEGLEEYLEKNEMNLKDIYQEKRTYYLEDNGDGWKINNIEKGALTKKSTSI